LLKKLNFSHVVGLGILDLQFRVIGLEPLLCISGFLLKVLYLKLVATVNLLNEHVTTGLGEF
jgi:hypothetical protein